MQTMDMAEFESNLRYLVNIDSGTGNAAGVARVAAFLEEKYRAAGYRVRERIFDEAYGPCVEARSHPEEDAIDLLVIGHMDTVFPNGTAEKRPFSVKDGIARGPGAADMKSGLVLGTVLAARLRAECPGLKVCFANNCDEERGSVSSINWLKSLAERSRYCFNMEAGRPDGSFLKMRKGILHLRVTMRGISAHAGVAPESGASAILEMARWICYFQNEAFLPVHFDTIRGGTAFNVIPDEACCEVDFRYRKQEELDRVLSAFERLKNDPFDPRVRAEVEILSSRPPMCVSRESEKLMALFEEEGGKLGQSVRFTESGGGSDASYAAAAGAAAVDACGPVGGEGHSSEEYCVLASAAERLELLVNVCKRL